MNSPAISIVLPVYNSGQYLAETINSLLAQTFTDFELIIIDDGSTDNSTEIISGYADKRIRLLRNERNFGLIYTLNKGVELAKGKYIARIDGDDICAPDRLERQLYYFQQDPSVAVVASTVTFIDASGAETGTWPLDRETTTSRQIKNRMPWENCIAHPSVMIDTAVARTYHYSTSQLHAEDYDLWLRLLADGQKIEKISEPLLYYRVHGTSITGSILRKSNPFFKQYRCKKNFLCQRIKQHRWGTFEWKVLLTTLLDGAGGIGKELKNRIKH